MDGIEEQEKDNRKQGNKVMHELCLVRDKGKQPCKLSPEQSLKEGLECKRRARAEVICIGRWSVQTA